ncbi:MAG: GntR family transcriptional regulator [Chloroflexota bacterium]
MARIVVGEGGDAPAPLEPAAPVVKRGPGRPQLRYERTISLVEDLIAERQLQPGDLLPPGHEIARLAGVSLISVRRALDELERSGRVVRHQGVGTFVGQPRIVAEPSRVGDLLATLGRGPEGEALTTTLLSLDRGRPDPAVCRALDLAEGDLAGHIAAPHGDRRSRPCRSARHASCATSPSSTRRRRALGGSLAGLAEQYGIAALHEEQYLHVGTPTADERRLLELHRPPARRPAAGRVGHRGRRPVRLLGAGVVSASDFVYISRLGTASCWREPTDGVGRPRFATETIRLRPLGEHRDGAFTGRPAACQAAESFFRCAAHGSSKRLDITARRRRVGWFAHQEQQFARCDPKPRPRKQHPSRGRSSCARPGA